MFLFVWITLGIMVNVPPLAMLSLEYEFCFCVVLFKLLYMSL